MFRGKLRWMYRGKLRWMFSGKPRRGMGDFLRGGKGFAAFFSAYQIKGFAPD
jgi:hypothetical protein